MRRGFLPVSSRSPECSAGSFSPPLASACTGCTTNSNSAAGAATCLCNAGYAGTGSGLGLACTSTHRGRGRAHEAEAHSWPAQASRLPPSPGCQANTYSAAGAASCTNCPAGGTSGSAASTCACSPGFSAAGTGASLVCTGASTDGLGRPRMRRTGWLTDCSVRWSTAGAPQPARRAATACPEPPVPVRSGAMRGRPNGSADNDSLERACPARPRPACPAGSYSNAQASGCTNCPDNSASGGNAATCQCNAGYAGSGFADTFNCTSMCTCAPLRAGTAAS